MRSLLQPLAPEVIGHLAIVFGSDAIEGIQFTIMPTDIFDREDEYASKELNYVEFRGNFDGKERVGFNHQLALSPVYNADGGGWETSMGASAFEWPIGRMDPFETSCEKLAADIICTSEIRISIGKLSPSPSLGKVDSPFLRVALREIEGLRQSIADTLGRPYVDKLLRINGYEAT